MKEMFRVWVIIIMALVCVVFSGCDLGSGKQGVNALLLVPRNAGANYYLMRDVLEEYGWNVIHTGVLDTITPCPWFATHGVVYPFVPDVRLEDITDIRDYDCLIITPAAGNAAPIENSHADILESSQALSLIKRADYYGLAVFSMCAGVRVLAAADVVRERFIVGAPRFREEYVAAGANYVGRPRNDNPPTIDRNIITSARGQTYNYANVMAIATVIEGNQGRGGKKSPSKDIVSMSSIDYSHEDVVWAKSYGGSGADGGRAFCETPTGGHLIVGYTFAPGAVDADMLVLKVDANGDMVWSRSFGGVGTEYGNACLALDDGYLLLGYTTSYGEGSKDVYLVRIDEDGNDIWSKTYGGKSWDVGTAMCRADNDNYYICGFSHSFGVGEEDIYLIKIDQEGNEIWSERFGGFRIDMANSIHSTPDGGCLVGATCGSYSPNTDFCLVKIDASGMQEWRKTYSATGTHGHGFDWCKSSSATNDGGTVMTGYSDCNDMMDVVVVKTDDEGNEQWLRTFGNHPFYDYGNAVCQSYDGYIVAGITKSMTKPTDTSRKIYNNDIYLVRLDTKGNIRGKQTIGGIGSDWANTVMATQGGNVLVCGHAENGAMASLDVCLLKIRMSDEGR
ncbi:hypothetical protein AMJ83_05805 [candidate division WOR_3 bacterium SM23_42]|uniref:DJ-1/PfpI domain-containing protein n=1 Tax=candidate division WOR_3 bacterium SM23_42 TaxID=1703779 RepID=A0A0S8FTX8_UNCW3|nr:MAG: hypothetical protein AMJ83_05805 [candidate division WOR_3 bacterium SM23_42]